MTVIPIVEIRKVEGDYIVYVNSTIISTQKTLAKATKKLADFVKSQPQLEGK